LASRLELIVVAKDQASGVLKGIDKSAGGLGKTFGTVLKSGAFIGIAALGGLATAGIAAGRSLARIEQIGAQTDAAIASTGGVANVTRAQIDKLAGTLENLTSVEAETITEGQNLLLTFKGIQNQAGAGNDIFDQATEAMVDMSVAMGQDMSSTAIQLGKSLNDPIQGLTALRRVGVQFTDDQEKQIKTMVEAGDVMGAQKVILGELTSQFGGSGEALGQTFGGQLQIVQHQLGTIAETIVARLLPTLQDLTERLNIFLTEHEEDIQKLIDDFVRFAQSEAWPVLKDAFAASKQGIEDIWDAGLKLKPVLDGLLETFQALPEPVHRFAAALGAATAALVLLNAAGLPVVGLIKFLGIGILGLAGLFTFIIALLLQFVTPVLVAGVVLHLLGVRFSDVKNAASDFITFIAGVPGAVKSALVGPFNDARDAINWVIRRIERLIEVINSIPSLPGGIPNPGGIIGGIGGILGRQFGGPVAAGFPYIVGERGPEWFVPKVAGEIIPNVTVRSMAAVPAAPVERGGDIHFHFSYQAQFGEMSLLERNRFQELVTNAVRRELKH
jgi:hypothetical protein